MKEEMKKILSAIFPDLIDYQIRKYSPIWEFESINHLRCLGCQGELIQIEDDFPEILEDNGLWDISGGDLDEFVCITCRRYYVTCGECTKYFDSETWKFDCDIGPVYLMKFLGYDLIQGTDMKFRPNKPEGDPILENSSGQWGYDSFLEHGVEAGNGFEYLSIETLKKYPEETIDYTPHHNETGVIIHYIGDRNQYWMDQDYNEMPTGPDGGACHFWKCPKCLDLLEVTDK